MSIEFSKYFGSEKANNPSLFKALGEKKFTAKIFEKEISYRTLNYWDENGYLLGEREKSDTDWRKLSFTDYIWIRFLDEIRKMGLSVELIVTSLFRELGIPVNDLIQISQEKYVKLKAMPFEKLLSKIDKGLVADRFCLMLVHIVSYKTPLSLRVYSDGEVKEAYGNPKFIGFWVEDFEKIRDASKIHNEFGRNFISISISSLIGDYIDTKSLDNIEGLNLLTHEELELLKHVRNKDVKEISVVLEDGSPVKLELTEVDYNADISKRVYEDMLNRDYVEVTYVTNSKKQVTSKRKTKIKLK